MGILAHFMDKTNRSPENFPLISRWLERWWEEKPAAPKIGFISKTGTPAHGCPASFIEWPRLMVCLEGERSYQIETPARHHVEMKAGQALYFSPGVWLTPLPARRFRSLGIHWEPEQIRIILRDKDPFAPPHAAWVLPREPGELPHLATQITSLMAHPFGQYAAEARLLLELGLLIRRFRTAAPPLHGRRHALYLRICAFLEEQFHQMHTRESVAALFGISPGHLTRLFREEGKQGFSAYLNALRLREAQALLSSTALPIQQIALQCGFTDPAYFSRLFKKRYGYPPGQAKQIR